jgi:hypothetical protein
MLHLAVKQHHIRSYKPLSISGGCRFNGYRWTTSSAPDHATHRQIGQDCCQYCLSDRGSHAAGCFGRVCSANACQNGILSKCLLMETVLFDIVYTILMFINLLIYDFLIMHNMLKTDKPTQTS